MRLWQFVQEATEMGAVRFVLYWSRCDCGHPACHLIGYTCRAEKASGKILGYYGTGRPLPR